jgi:hypothetical protein
VVEGIEAVLAEKFARYAAGGLAGTVRRREEPGSRTAQTGFPARAQSAAAKGSPAAGK